MMRSDDTRSIVLFGGACLVGFVIVGPSSRLVRVVLVIAVTCGACMWILSSHQEAENSVRKDDATAIVLAGRRDKPDSVSVFATLVHPEATSAIASLSSLSRPGRRAAVHAVVSATENVIRAYHAVLAVDVVNAKASSCMDDLRDRTIVALDALQCLNMDNVDHASDVALTAERKLRKLFVRFRQIAANKLSKQGAPYPLDPSDDRRFVR